jgi:hypothetical protein
LLPACNQSFVQTEFVANADQRRVKGGAPNSVIPLPSNSWSFCSLRAIAVPPLQQVATRDKIDSTEL